MLDVMTDLLPFFKRKPKPPGSDPFGEFQNDAERLAAVVSRHGRDVQVARFLSRALICIAVLFAAADERAQALATLAVRLLAGLTSYL